MTKPNFVCCLFLDENWNFLHRTCLAFRGTHITYPEGFFKNPKVRYLVIELVNSCSECKDVEIPSPPSP